MKKKFNDVRNAIKNGTYYSALALALTFPDICCSVENGLQDGQNSNRTMYIDWVNKHMPNDSFTFPLSGFEEQTFRGEMCYSLRCKVLHNGNTNVQNTKLNVTVDDFELIFPSDDEASWGFRYVNKKQPDGSSRTITQIYIDYLCKQLCDAAEAFYDSWPNKADFEQHSF